jgi:hypothetical protein
VERAVQAGGERIWEREERRGTRVGGRRMECGKVHWRREEVDGTAMKEK